MKASVSFDEPPPGVVAPIAAAEAAPAALPARIRSLVDHSRSCDRLRPVGDDTHRPADARHGRGVRGAVLMKVLSCFNVWDFQKGDQDPRSLDQKFPPGPLSLLFSHYSERMDPRHQLRDSSPTMEAIKRANSTMSFYEFMLFARESSICPKILRVGVLRLIFVGINPRERAWGDSCTLSGDLRHADMSLVNEELHYEQFEEALIRCALVAFPDSPAIECVELLIGAMSFDGVGLGGATSECMRRLRRYLRGKTIEASHMGSAEATFLKRKVDLGALQEEPHVMHGTPTNPLPIHLLGPLAGTGMNKDGSTNGGGNSVNQAKKTHEFVRAGDAVHLDVGAMKKGGNVLARLALYHPDLKEALLPVRLDLTATQNRLYRPFLGHDIDMGYLHQQSGSSSDMEKGTIGAADSGSVRAPPIKSEVIAVPATAPAIGDAEKTKDASGAEGSVRELFWILVQNVHDREICIDAEIDAATSPGSPQRPGARSSPGKRGALGLAAATDTLSCFQCEVNLRPMAPGLTRRIKVFVDVGSPLEMAASIVIKAHTADHLELIEQVHTVPIYGSCIPPKMSADMKRSNQRSRVPMLQKTAPSGPVLGATFVGQRTFRADGAIAPLLSDHGSGATPGLISASTQSLLSPSPSRGNLAVTMASSRSCHQLGTLESADIARLRSSTSSSALLSRKMPSAAGPRRGGGAMR